MPAGVEEAVGEAARRLQQGEVVGYPTETVWGLAAHPDGLGALYGLKGREADKPVQVSARDAAAAARLTEEGAAFRVLAALWPGPLTLVVPASAECPPELAPGGWVGLRVPDHPVALALLRRSGGILATTSLNPSGQPAARSLEEARAYGLVPFLLPDGGIPARGLASTVVRVREEALEVLREGAFPVQVLRERLRAAGWQGEAG